MPLDRVVIGAGLVGSLLGCFLAHNGHKVHIFEKRSDLRRSNRHSGRSINLSLSIRGIKALEEIGLMDAIRPHCVPMYGRAIHPNDGQEQFQSYGPHPHCMHYSISRTRLNQILLDNAENFGCHIYFESELERLDVSQPSFQLKGDNPNLAFNQLYATDGAGSNVRGLMAKQKLISEQKEPLDHAYKELSLSAESASRANLNTEALHIWPRQNFMAIALPNADMSFTVTLFMPAAGEVSFAKLDSSKEIERFFKQHFEQLTQLIPDYLSQYQSNPIGILGTVRCYPWHYQDKVLLLGDAAHAIVPFHGQGMNCGFEDVLKLHQLQQSSSPKTVFERFSQERKKDADAIATMALENYIEMRFGVTDPKTLAIKKLAFDLEKDPSNDFQSRYSMVMFDTIPYHQAYIKGKQQQQELEARLDLA